MTASTQGSASPYYGQPQNTSTYYNMTATNSGELLKTGEGVLHYITFNKATAGSVFTVYDGLTASGTLIATITVPSSPQLSTLAYDAYFKTGLFIVQATQASDVTITYR